MTTGRGQGVPRKGKMRAGENGKTQAMKRRAEVGAQDKTSKLANRTFETRDRG